MNTGAAPGPGSDQRPESRWQMVVRQSRALIEAIRENDEAAVEDAVLALSQSRRIFAPLVFGLGAFVMLFQGLRMLFSNWKLFLIQVLPAMWIWLALLDLKAHTYKGKSFHSWHGAVVLVLVIGITLVTAACFYLNAVFAFAISQPGGPTIRPAFGQARRHLHVILVIGLVVGLALGFSTIVVPRWGHPWFAISLGIVVGVMMLTYVAVPARMVGIKPAGTRRDKMATAAIGGTMSMIICAPAYLIGRIGILLLGSKALFPLAVFLLVIGFALMAGATGAVKAIKMSAKLAAGRTAAAAESPATAGSTPP
jgi:hypothetical protein